MICTYCQPHVDHGRLFEFIGQLKRIKLRLETTLSTADPGLASDLPPEFRIAAQAKLDQIIAILQSLEDITKPVELSVLISSQVSGA